MSDEWVETTLDQLVTISRGISYNSEQTAGSDKSVPFLNLKSVERGGGYRDDGLKRYSGPIKESQRLNEGDLLVANTDLTRERAILGAPVMVPKGLEGATFSHHLSVLRPLIDTFDIRFLNLVLQSPDVREHLIARGRGTTVMGVSARDIGNTPVYMPPIPDQRRIVDLMTHLDTHIANLQAESSALAQAISALRVDLMVDSAQWSIARLDDVAEVQLGRMLSKDRASQGDLAPYIRNANVQWGGLDLSDLKKMDFPEDQRAKYALRAGDILTCEGGDPGRSVRLDTDVPGVFYQKAVHRVRVLGLEMDSAYLYEWLVHTYETGRIADLCTTTTIAHLTAEKFKSLMVRYPTVSQQRQIAELIKNIRLASRSVEREFAHLVQYRAVLLTSILSEALTVDTGLDALIEAS